MKILLFQILPNAHLCACSHQHVTCFRNYHVRTNCSFNLKKPLRFVSSEFTQPTQARFSLLRNISLGIEIWNENICWISICSQFYDPSTPNLQFELESKHIFNVKHSKIAKCSYVRCHNRTFIKQKAPIR